MMQPSALLTLLLCMGVPVLGAGREAAPASQIVPPVTDPLPIIVRPAMLGDHIVELAGHPVQVAYARVVGAYGTRALVVETESRVRGARRGRIVVLLETGALRVPPGQLVGETIQVVGVARTLLGVQLTGEVAWPDALDRGRVRRLDIRGAVLASSVQTPDGIELTTRAS